MSFDRLDELGRRLEALEHAQAMLGVDEAVMMPTGGGEKRAESMSVLAGMVHEMATAPEVADWLAEAEGQDLGAIQQRAVAEFRRVHTNMTCLSGDFVRRQVKARMRAEQLWREMRPRSDWAGFLPAFEQVVALAREEARMRAEATGLAPYDAMMDQYDPGNRVADIAPVFARLSAFLTDFVPEALEAQARRDSARPKRKLAGPFPIDRQKALGMAMMEALGFDFAHGRLDVSHHPFCGGVPSDVRMTTRYDTADFLSALMGTLHETGHALYEQGLPAEWSHWPVGRARGMAFHESQSLFVEMQLARSPEFWAWGLPLLGEHLGPEAVSDWTVEDILGHVHRIERGLIRVDADEATYPLHIILRFELEQGLIDGTLAPADIPEAWDAGMRASLGLSTRDDPANGPMQDVHWPSGAFGYFPSYTQGALIAAQLRAAMARDIPDLDDHVREGRFVSLNDWRREKIWSLASTLSTPDLLVAATGEPLNPGYFEDHLKARYLGA
ncbi:carboxypeptidase Taq [Devosia enhydra]|uniref:Metal-dependent carboxypeptidase n=1 Tax=Devosia enhydra TaxID=665118 RepID=A0A1K2HTJ7_9HYPH|nr:carboxypeptidase M32 [Devosia enhydra]SFZ81503.1 carboxypeptidase Taq [Devosia enhydra]